MSLKLALGTVQFGLDYGISNLQGKIPLAEVDDILSAAKRYGINTLDTAAAYGESEQVLGRLNASKDFSLVTKIPSLSKINITIPEVVKESLTRLKSKKLNALMFHDADDLLAVNGADLYQQAILLKQQGLVDKLGVSVYHPKQLLNVMDKCDIDIVQFPLNCLDQRFIHANITNQLTKKNIEVHVRSLFLQGLLLLPLEQLAPYFQKYKTQLTLFHRKCEELQCHPLTLALSIIHVTPFIDKAVVGCCSKIQLDQIVEHYYLAENLSLKNIDHIKVLASDDQCLINPSFWPI